MTFRLTTLLYLFALVAASLAAFGAMGIPVALLVLLAWAAMFATPQIGRLNFLAAVGIALAILALLLPAVEMGREEARQLQCKINLRQIAFSVLNFHDARGEFPLAAGHRRVNNDVHSWRVQVLPFTEATHYWIRYNFDEPWNSPTNLQTVSQVSIDLHCCPTHSVQRLTNYFAITDPETAWGDGKIRTFDDVTDGLSNTILLIEAAGRGIHWAQPKDLTFDEAVDLLTEALPSDGSDGHRVDNGYFYKPSYVRNVAMCDGSVHPLRVPMPREDAIALLTASGGEVVDVELVAKLSAPVLDYGRVWAFSVFVLLALLPAIPALRTRIWPVSAAERQREEEVVQIDRESRPPSDPTADGPTTP